MELMRKDANEAKKQERERDCKRRPTLHRALPATEVRKSRLHGSLWRENIKYEPATWESRLRTSTDLDVTPVHKTAVFRPIP
jgi:fructosamine-3-kinase